MEWYFPEEGDDVIGVITSKTGENYFIQIGIVSI